MRKARFRLRKAARDDLLSIGLYTERIWGRDQRSIYLRKLNEKFGHVARKPKLGIARDAIRPGYRSVRYGRHIIFYREVLGGIEVVRVLHESMDARRHLESE